MPPYIYNPNILISVVHTTVLRSFRVYHAPEYKYCTRGRQPGTHCGSERDFCVREANYELSAEYKRIIEGYRDSNIGAIYAFSGEYICVQTL